MKYILDIKLDEEKRNIYEKLLDNKDILERFQGKIAEEETKIERNLKVRNGQLLKRGDGPIDYS